MSTTIESRIKDASKHRFEKSTTEDLLEYLAHFELPVHDTDTQDKMRHRILAHLGIVSQSGEVVRNQQRVAKAREDIRPPYNLSPNGLWKGRRYLIKIMPPPGSKLGKAEPIGWNGKATYWLPYNETHSVPEPIYAVLKDRRQRVSKQVKVKHPDGLETITTEWEFNEMPMVDYGVDPKTAHLAGSILEWYRGKKPSWFKERSTRELQTIAGLLDIPLKNKNGMVEMSKSNEELVSDIFVALFSYPDVEDADKAA
jgi:hypothetical protein